MKKLLLIALLFITWSGVALAQNDEQDIFNDTNPGQKEDNKESTDEQPGAGAAKKPPAKPFVRLVLPVDSITQLVTYTEVVEQSESASDSLYKRAKRWAMSNFSKMGERPKEVFEVDKENAKLVIFGYIDAFTYPNKFAKTNMGYHRFKMTVWIKEGRYKYTITNLVNENKLYPGDKGLPTQTYFEFYNTTSTNPKGADAILRAADGDIKKLIETFKKEMKDPIIVDEEDW